MKRKFYCRMNESPLFTVESIMNWTFQTVMRSCKEFEIPTLHRKFFEILKFVFLSEVAHIKSFCVKFSALISKLKILENWYLSPRIFKVRTYIWSLSKKNYGAPMKPSELFCFKDPKISQRCRARQSSWQGLRSYISFSSTYFSHGCTRHSRMSACIRDF